MKLQIIVSKEVAEKLQELARADRRSLSGYCGRLLTEHAEDPSGAGKQYIQAHQPK